VDPSPAAERLVITSARQLGLTGRGVHRVLRVARTIADLSGETQISEANVRSALHMRTGA
jgi:magnesium chelatase family protein